MRHIRSGIPSLSLSHPPSAPVIGAVLLQGAVRPGDGHGPVHGVIGIQCPGSPVTGAQVFHGQDHLRQVAVFVVLIALQNTSIKTILLEHILLLVISSTHH